MNPQPAERDWQQEAQFWQMKYIEQQLHYNQVIAMLSRGPILETIAAQAKSQQADQAVQQAVAQAAAASANIPTTVAPPTPIKRPAKRAPAKGRAAQ